MRIQLITTLYLLGIIAGLCGVSAAAQDSAAQSGGSQKTNMATEPGQVSQEYHTLHRQLIWDQIGSVEESLSPSETDTLDELIRQLQSLEIPKKSTPQEPNQPLSSQADATANSSPAEKPQASEEIETLSPQDELTLTLEKIDTITSPLQLADVLYRQGYYDLAFDNYCTVAEQLPEEHVTDRQWVLFQKANCCRYSNPNEAVGFYNELTQSFPNSKWAAAANSRRKIIEWNQANQIKDLVKNEADDTNNG